MFGQSAGPEWVGRAVARYYSDLPSIVHPLTPDRVDYRGRESGYCYTLGWPEVRLEDVGWKLGWWLVETVKSSSSGFQVDGRSWNTTKNF